MVLHPTGGPAARRIAGLPNAISILRLAVAVYFPAAPPEWRLPLVVVGAGTDWLDGTLARRLGLKSVGGALLDAIADKAFTLSVLLTMTAVGELRWWMVVCVLLRDLAVALVAAYALVRRDLGAFRRMVPAPAGKVTTAALFAWFVTLLVPGLASLHPPLFLLASACSAWAAVEYLRRFAAALRAE